MRSDTRRATVSLYYTACLSGPGGSLRRMRLAYRCKLTTLLFVCSNSERPTRTVNCRWVAERFVKNARTTDTFNAVDADSNYVADTRVSRHCWHRPRDRWRPRPPPEVRVSCLSLLRLICVTTINQSINHLLAIITWGKNTENTISTNGRYNQAETALIVDLKTHINQLQSYYNRSLTSS